MKSIRKSEEATRAIFATLLLLGIFSVASYYVLTTPEEEPIEASKLVIVKPSEIPIRSEVELTRYVQFLLKLIKRPTIPLKRNR